MDTSAFQLSRIYGQGWNVAKQLLAGGTEDLDAKRAATLNPYRTVEERTRWSKGFEEGLLSRTGGRATATLRSWRPEDGR